MAISGEENYRFCYACGDRLQASIILICPDCLDTECENFQDLSSEEDLEVDEST